MTIYTIELEKLGLQAGERILDVGCGLGRHSITAYQNYQVDATGIDLSLEDLKQTAERFVDFQQSDAQKSLNLAQCSGLQLPFADSTFDRVVCSEVLEHIEDYPAVLAEIFRVLKPGGNFAASVPAWFPEWVCWSLSKPYIEATGHLRIFTRKELRRAIEHSGMSFVQEHRAHGLHGPFWWLQCLLWERREQSEAVAAYKRLLDWDLFQAPRLTRTLDRWMNPITGKSVVMYFSKSSEA